MGRNTVNVYKFNYGLAIGSFIQRATIGTTSECSMPGSLDMGDVIFYANLLKMKN